MDLHGEVVLRQRVSLGVGCHAVFWICRHCDRADSAIAATRAALKPGSGNAAAPTAAISGVRRGGSTHRDRQRQYRHPALSRDGSGFPFDHFSGTMRLWDVGNNLGNELHVRIVDTGAHRLSAVEPVRFDGIANRIGMNVEFTGDGADFPVPGVKNSSESEHEFPG
jgi:hypothetical protein